MSFAQNFTKVQGRAIATLDTVVLKFTTRDSSNEPVDLAGVTVGRLDIKLDLTESAVVQKSIGSGMVIAPDQVAEKGVLRVTLSGGVGGDTDRDEQIHRYDGFIEIGGDRQYFVLPQSEIEFVDVVTK